MAIRTNKDRVLNIGNHNTTFDPTYDRSDWTHTSLLACARAFSPNFELSMPIPSQCMQINNKHDNTASTLYITDNVYKKIFALSQIQYQLDKIISNSDKLKTPKHIDFYATGYLLDSGDFAIDNLQIPIIDYIQNKSKDIRAIAHSIATTKIPSAFHIESSSPMIDYLRTTHIPTDKHHLKKLFALYGTTKSRLENLNNQEFNNCFSLKEIADSIVPEIPTHEEIVSGALIIPPAIESYLPNEYGAKELVSTMLNSLECLVTEYSKHPKNNTVKPLYLERIVNCATIETSKSISIGNTLQPAYLDDYIK
jgi:hypothetical protein